MEMSIKRERERERERERARTVPTTALSEISFKKPAFFLPVLIKPLLYQTTKKNVKQKINKK
jgi:hypothetical protein